ncbi:MAG: hypothetical protein ABFQ62_03705 [Patescibacteria group bacterium]
MKPNKTTKQNFSKGKSKLKFVLFLYFFMSLVTSFLDIAMDIFSITDIIRTTFLVILLFSIYRGNKIAKGILVFLSVVGIIFIPLFILWFSDQILLLFFFCGLFLIYFCMGVYLWKSKDINDFLIRQRNKYLKQKGNIKDGQKKLFRIIQISIGYFLTVLLHRWFVGQPFPADIIRFMVVALVGMQAYSGNSSFMKVFMLLLVFFAISSFVLLMNFWSYVILSVMYFAKTLISVFFLWALLRSKDINEFIRHGQKTVIEKK